MKSPPSFIFLCLLVLPFTLSAQTKATYLADETAYELMKKISPNTGKSAEAIISDIEYDRYKERYTIEMTAIWQAGVTMFADTEIFKVKGVLSVNRNGTNKTFRETWRNSAVKRAWTDEEIAIGVGLAAATLDAATSDSPSRSTSSASSYSSNMVYVICLHNLSDSDINYSIRVKNANDEWENGKIESGKNYYWHTSNSNGFEIKFDADFSSSNDYKVYNLPGNKVNKNSYPSGSGLCGVAKGYNFKNEGNNVIDLYYK